MTKFSALSPARSISTWVSGLRSECDSLRLRIELRCPDLLDAHYALELDLLTLAAMCLRPTSPSRDGGVPALPSGALVLKADEVERQFRELVVAAAGYDALPAPNLERSHNQVPLAQAGEAEAVQALMEFHARDSAYRLRSALAQQLYGDGAKRVRSNCPEGV